MLFQLKRCGRRFTFGWCSTTGVALWIGDWRWGWWWCREGRFGRNESLLHALLLLHPPVLEPDLHLRLVELEGGGDFDPSGSGQIFVEMEFFLQFRQLFGGEVGAPRVVGSAAARTTAAVAAPRTARSETVIRSWCYKFQQKNTTY